jgi:hypothetical protein
MPTLAEKTQPGGPGTPSRAETVRAEALFASTLQASQQPSPTEVGRVVATTLQRLGAGGCTARLAGEFGDHPELAARRMRWALATIGGLQQAPDSIPTFTARALALAG